MNIYHVRVCILITYSGQLLSKVDALCQEGILGGEASVRCKAACFQTARGGAPYIDRESSSAVTSHSSASIHFNWGHSLQPTVHSPQFSVHSLQSTVHSS